MLAVPVILATRIVFSIAIDTTLDTAVALASVPTLARMILQSLQVANSKQSFTQNLGIAAAVAATIVATMLSRLLLPLLYPFLPPLL